MINRKIKLLFNGNGAVGKTSLLIKYTTGEFPCEYVPTVMECCTMNVTYKDIKFNMELWDTGGGEDYPRLRPLSYPNTTCFVLCFSLVNLNSFNSLKTTWLPEIRHFDQDIPILLVGLKSDLIESNEKIESCYFRYIYQKITTEKCLQMAKDIGANGYIECSSFNNSNVNVVIKKAIQLSYEYLRTYKTFKK
ncbi:Rho GTPase, putative [Entamoeba invadens IP1]|uniref:small monomeric GTPase n=1 Tax=Entamoeba invadens IP1 TaxID=370355 RepID=A0A0A1TX75_ENTIV|nr:Rho GTPase, putative [Entamoeba invadens IP1]ELP85868.1 Rho GTPase, putative [Entamoeba invadens IP1]|eukprot:XP_004185214.1 Rho GTPase, putative [Entamoeba invadens IP1]